MKVKSIIFHILEMIIVMMLVLSVKLYTDYGKFLELKPPKATTVEEYYLINSDKYQNAVEDAKEKGASIEIKENTYICIYDYSDETNYTEEYLHSEEFQTAMDNYFEGVSEENMKRAKKLSLITGVPHLKYIYRGIYNGKIIYEKVYEV